MSTLLQDLRFSIRMLAKSPGFTAVALLTLALALGTNTATFSLAYAVLFRPLIERAPKEVVSIHTAVRGAERSFRRFTYAEFERLAAAQEIFADVSALSVARVGVGTAPGGPLQRTLAHVVSANMFDLLGIQPAQGRFFRPEEGAPGAGQAVLVASHGFWQRHGGRPDFVGSTVWVNGQPCTVIGITPPSFGGLSALMAPDFWLPLGLYGSVGSPSSRAAGHADLRRDDNHTLLLTARLAPGIDLEAARLRLPSLALELDRLAAAPTSARATRERELMLAPPSRFSVSPQPSSTAELYLLTAPLVFMAGSVLVIACLNLANMFLARGATRTREVAVRFALGATRWRVMRQLLLEGLLLALGGGLIGLGVSVWANHALVASLSAALRTVEEAAINLRPDLEPAVLLFTLAACTASALLFGLVPALRACRRDVVKDLKAQGGESADGWNRFFAGRHLLVMAQIALSIMLLFSAGLFLRAALEARHIALGFSTGRSLISKLDYSLRPAGHAAARRSLDTVRAHVAALPGVERVAFSTQPPLSSGEHARHVAPAGSPPDAETVPALFSGASDGYFAALDIPVLAGREFSPVESGDPAAPPVAIIDASLARRLFPADNPLGQRLRFAAPSGTTAGEFEIVGVIGEHRQEFLDRAPDYRIYLPLARTLGGEVFVHTALGHAAAVVTAIEPVRAALLAGDPDLPLLGHEPMETFAEGEASLWSAQFAALLAGVFGTVALLLAVLGVYAVKSHAVARRTREIGIRAALGARPTDLVAMILRETSAQIAVAALAGVVFALLAGRALSVLIYHVSPADPLALGGAVFVLAATALAASLPPARRAARVNPMIALRAE